MSDSSNFSNYPTKISWVFVHAVLSLNGFEAKGIDGKNFIHYRKGDLTVQFPKEKDVAPIWLEPLS